MEAANFCSPRGYLKQAVTSSLNFFVIFPILLDKWIAARYHCRMTYPTCKGCGKPTCAASLPADPHCHTAGCWLQESAEQVCFDAAEQEAEDAYNEM